MKCLYCEQEVSVDPQGYIASHDHKGKQCTGSGFTPSKMSRDAEFVDMVRQLTRKEKKK